MKTRRPTSLATKKKLMQAKSEIAPEVVIAIRQCYAANMKVKDLSQKFGFSVSRISNIVNGHTYSY